MYVVLSLIFLLKTFTYSCDPHSVVDYSIKNNFEFMSAKGQYIQNGPVQLWVEIFGDIAHPAVILISGAGASARFWTDEFCNGIENCGYCVIRFDHRDTGLSSSIDYDKNPYSVFDLANDVLAFMDKLEIQRAHLVGHSMGGIVSQILAVYHPDRCTSFTSMSVATVGPNISPSPEIMNELMKNHPTEDYEESLEGFMHSWKILNGSIPLDQDLATAYTLDLYKRSNHPVGVAWNHIHAQQDLKDLPTKLQSNTTSGLFIHGEKDPLIPLEGAKRTFHATPNSVLEIIPHMGHMIFNHELQSQLTEHLLHHFLNFEPLFVGNPVDIEQKLKELLHPASKLEDNSHYLQILSQIALSQAMQKRFVEAHETLNTAEALLRPGDHLAKVRILLERGRTFMQREDFKTAADYFMQSYTLSKKHHFDEHTANAAHMIAIVSDTPEEKIKWNSLAIDLVENSDSMKAKKWLGSLYHNLGQSYDEAGHYQDSLQAIEHSLEIRKQEGYLPNIRAAKWALGRALRQLDRSEEALNILRSLLEEYEVMLQKGTLDIPIEVLLRGLVYEELAELDLSQRTHFAKLAYEDLSKDEWFKSLGTKRLERLKTLMRSD